MKKLFLTITLATGLAFAVNYYAYACPDPDCSTEGKSITYWCDAGSGNCLCTVYACEKVQ